MSPLLKVCLDCGQLSDQPRCEVHRPAPKPKRPEMQRGYDYQWRKLSKRARKLSPLCEDCGATSDLQADHSPEAWERKARGLPVRLQDIAVVCGPCNRKRGAARGENIVDRGERGLIVVGGQPPPLAKFLTDQKPSSRSGVL